MSVCLFVSNIQQNLGNDLDAKYKVSYHPGTKNRRYLILFAKLYLPVVSHISVALGSAQESTVWAGRQKVHTVALTRRALSLRGPNKDHDPPNKDFHVS